jgi:acyl carrier protein
MEIALDLDQAEMKRIDPSVTAADLKKWDSLGHLKLIMELERCFGIEFDDQQIVRLASVETIMTMVENRE